MAHTQQEPHWKGAAEQQWALVSGAVWGGGSQRALGGVTEWGREGGKTGPGRGTPPFPLPRV